MNPLVLTGVERHFGDARNVLDGVDLSVAPGEVVGLLGRNGAGKTTLMRLALGMLRPSGGKVRMFGLDPTEHPVDVKRRIGYVAESRTLPHYLRVNEVFAMHAELFPTWDDRLARRLSERFEVSPRERVKNLSKGQTRHVDVVCALSHRPELLLLDEPASGLDPAARREFLQVALESLDETECAIVFSTHQMTDVERLASRVVFLERGRLLLDEPLDGLQESVSLVRVTGEHVDAKAIERRVETLGVRVSGDEVRALVRVPAADVAQKLEGAINGARLDVRAVPLEELFVEIAETSGARRAQKVR